MSDWLSPPDCEALHDQNQGQFGFTVLVVLGSIISNIPQQYRIARRRSAEGVSAYFLLTGLVSATCNLANIIILSQDIFDCCQSGGISNYECTTAVMGIVVSGAAWLAMFLM